MASETFASASRASTKIQLIALGIIIIFVITIALYFIYADSPDIKKIATTAPPATTTPVAGTTTTPVAGTTTTPVAGTTTTPVAGTTTTPVAGTTTTPVAGTTTTPVAGTTTTPVAGTTTTPVAVTTTPVAVTTTPVAVTTTPAVSVAATTTPTNVLTTAPANISLLFNQPSNTISVGTAATPVPPSNTTSAATIAPITMTPAPTLPTYPYIYRGYDVGGTDIGSSPYLNESSCISACNNAANCSGYIVNKNISDFQDGSAYQCWAKNYSESNPRSGAGIAYRTVYSKIPLPLFNNL